MVVKFQIVCSYFMHLKFDSKVFSYLFVTGLILAMAVFAAMGTLDGVLAEPIRLRPQRVC